MILFRLSTFICSIVLLFLAGCGARHPSGNHLKDEDNRHMTCRYDGDDFEVEYFGSDYSGSADDGYDEAAVSCGTNVSALYDGDDIIVFDGNRRGFYSEFADDANSHALVAAGTNVAGGYDGDNFIVYDALNNDFSSEFADDDVAVAKMAAGEDLVMFYDGDNLMIYDARRHSFSSEFADDNEPNAAIAAGRGGALAYDGDNLFAYCVYQGRWTSEFADDGEHAEAGVNEDTGQPQIRVGSRMFELNPLRCDIESN